MNEPNKTYSIDEIREILGKDKRTVTKYIDAAGYPTKDSYSESEVAWIREVQSIKEEQSNISYEDVKTEIEGRKSEIQRQKLLGGSPATSSDDNNNGSNSATNVAIPAQPPVDTDFVGGIVENIVKEQVATHIIRCIHQLPTMMNNAIKASLPELEAAANIALQQNRERLEPMRRIETVKTESHLLEGEMVDVENDISEDDDDDDEEELDDDMSVDSYD